MSPSAWFPVPTATTPARVRLVCLPHAGGGVAVFHPWKRLLPPDIELCAVRLPGRDSRYHEPLRVDSRQLVEELADALADAPPVPSLALFGHSMGAVLAFELARALAARRLRPDLLIVSGRGAPHRQQASADQLHRLGDAAFIDKLHERYGGIPQAVLDDPALLAIFLPILRADFRLVESYRYAPGPPGDWPLMAYGGTDDRVAGRQDMEQWGAYTSGPFRLQMLPGGHFFHQTQHELLVPRLVDDLRRWCLSLR